jgi:tocopherol O-methyltransferase
MKDTGLTFDGSVEDLHRSVRSQYDNLSGLFEQMWGEHMHCGYWDLDDPGVPREVAQRRTNQELIAFGGLTPGARVLDSGCGIGASAVMLAGELGCDVDGITLSTDQVRRATQKAAAAGVADRVRFRAMDAAHTDYADGTFDVVWSVESFDVMPDKRAYLAECARVLKPGGRLVVSTWCGRDERLTPGEVRMLRRLYRDFAISHVIPLNRCAALCTEVGLTGVSSADWTDHIRATWKISAEMIKPVVLNPSALGKLVRAKGFGMVSFMSAMPRMNRAFERGVMRYGVFRATKPS